VSNALNKINDLVAKRCDRKSHWQMFFFDRGAIVFNDLAVGAQKSLTLFQNKFGAFIRILDFSTSILLSISALKPRSFFDIL
jgi:hypothetical protein